MWHRIRTYELPSDNELPRLNEFHAVVFTSVLHCCLLSCLKQATTLKSQVFAVIYS